MISCLQVLYSRIYVSPCCCYTTYCQFNLLPHFPLPACHCSLPASSCSAPDLLFLIFPFPKCTPTVLSDPLKFFYLALTSLFHSSVFSILQPPCQFASVGQEVYYCPCKACAQTCVLMLSLSGCRCVSALSCVLFFSFFSRHSFSA